jgi:hypothetical protein
MQGFEEQGKNERLWVFFRKPKLIENVGKHKSEDIVKLVEEKAEK